jgi:DNA repair protein RadC
MKAIQEILQFPLSGMPKRYKTARHKTLPLREQPAYRVASKPDACTLSELLAVIVGGSEQMETSEHLLERFKTVQALAQAHPNEIAKVRGMGSQTALRLKAALSLARKLMERQEERILIMNPQDAYDVVRPILEGRDQENLVVVVSDTRNRVLEIVVVYQGAVNSAQVRVAELFRPAIRLNAPSIILAHNHPSGDPNPSPEDIALTRAVREAGKLLDIDMLDHIVVGTGRYISLKEKQLGFS